MFSTYYTVLKPLLGWDDASNDDLERLVTRAGSLGLTIRAGQVIEFFSVDRWSGEVITIKVDGAWSYGTLEVLAKHLEMVDVLRGRG